MTQIARATFQDELAKLHALVLDLAYKVKANGELLLDFLKHKDVDKLFMQIKDKDNEIDDARWQVHDFGDELIVLQQPVAKDFRQIITAIQVTDNFERIGDHFKKTAKQIEKFSLSDIEVPPEIIEMAELSLKMVSEAIKAYTEIDKGEVNEIELLDDQVDLLRRQSVKKTITSIKEAPEEKIDKFTRLLFVAQSFERAADHAAKIGQLVNFAITGERNK